ncbi:MAG: hypothetical protein A6F71_10855 [Cycloclasticus sp. symbiont of Poecilosclerida sp. M]|nr:MAG: hypothetical protein A6F71_10855 [Cycloclasticus sp. symbiont of Poecilosclerida sp. M]
MPLEIPAITANMAAVPVLASFSAQARGIKFYDVPLPEISVGDHFSCVLEPLNPWDANCIALKLSPTRTLGHLAREASVHLFPLLTAGFEASG